MSLVWKMILRSLMYVVEHEIKKSNDLLIH